MWTQMEKQVPEHTEAQKAPDQPETAAAQLGQIVQAASAGDNRRPLDLDAAMRERMEQQFGLDFSAVRLEESSLPGRLGADAVAQGDVIRFAPGAYRPDTPEGERLLSHELGHLVRQSRGIDPAARAGLPFYDPIAEHAADDMAFQAASGGLSAGPVRSFSPAPAAQAPMEGNRFTSWISGRAKKLGWSLFRSRSDGFKLDDLDAEDLPSNDTSPAPQPAVLDDEDDYEEGIINDGLILDDDIPAPPPAAMEENGSGEGGSDVAGPDIGNVFGNDSRPRALAGIGQWFGGMLGGLKQRFAQWSAPAAEDGEEEYQGGHQFDVLRNIALQRRAERRAAYRAAKAERRAAQAARRAARAAQAAPAPAPVEEAPASAAPAVEAAAPAVEETPAAPAAPPVLDDGGNEEEVIIGANDTDDLVADENGDLVLVDENGSPVPVGEGGNEEQAIIGNDAENLLSNRASPFSQSPVSVEDGEDDGLELEDLDAGGSLSDATSPISQLPAPDDDDDDYDDDFSDQGLFSL